MSDKHHANSAAKASLAILISGRGSNMQSIAKACQTGDLNAKVSIVISNRPDAQGLFIAKRLGLETAVVDHQGYASREAFEQQLVQLLQLHSPDWIVLAGFMRILTADFVAQYAGRILNIHPSLLPAYPGLDTHARALAAGDKEAGASVHIVTPELDAGPVIAQTRVPIHISDTPEKLAERVLAEEHALYINALQICVKGDK